MPFFSPTLETVFMQSGDLSVGVNGKNEAALYDGCQCMTPSLLAMFNLKKCSINNVLSMRRIMLSVSN